MVSLLHSQQSKAESNRSRYSLTQLSSQVGDGEVLLGTVRLEGKHVLSPLHPLILELLLDHAALLAQ